MPAPKPIPFTEDELKWVTCSICGEDTLGESMRKKPLRLPKHHLTTRYVAVRVYGRPRCNECVDENPDEGEDFPTRQCCEPVWVGE